MFNFYVYILSFLVAPTYVYLEPRKPPDTGFQRDSVYRLPVNQYRSQLFSRALANAVTNRELVDENELTVNVLRTVTTSNR